MTERRLPPQELSADDKPAYVHAVYSPHRTGLPHLSVLFAPDGTVAAEPCASVAEAERHRFAAMATARARDVGVD